MACSNCVSDIFKDKLGRCKRCMWTNFFLLLFSGLACLFSDLLMLDTVQYIALLMLLLLTAVLMILHLSFYFYYHYQGVKANHKK